MRGGRNTSIKYYKTKKLDEPTPPEVPAGMYQEQDDIDLDDDYDYDNNGLDDFDHVEDDINYIDDFEDENIPTSLSDPPSLKPENLDSHPHDNYKGVYDQDEYLQDGYGAGDGYGTGSEELVSYDRSYDPSYVESYIDDGDSLNESAEESMASLVSHNKIPFIHSYHLSIDGKSSKTSEESLDLLENYLEFNQKLEDFPPAPDTPKYQSFDDLDLYDLSSPLINGINIGGNLNHRFKNISPNIRSLGYRSCVRSFHYSFDELELVKKIDELDSISLVDSTTPEADSATPPLKFGDELNEANLSKFHQDLDNVDSDAAEHPNQSQLEIDKTLQLLEFLKLLTPNPGLLKKPELVETPELSESPELAEKPELMETPLPEDPSSSQNEIDRTLKLLEGMPSVGPDKLGSDKSLAVETLTEPPTKINRKSINEMMNLLDSLQINNAVSQHDKRESIENMMNFLKNIQMTQPEGSQPELPAKSKFVAKEPKLKGTSTSSNTNSSMSTSSSDDFNHSSFVDEKLNILEKDLIDEINQLPEDFDFDVNPDLIDQFNNLNDSIKLNVPSAFMRSNSFNKKPKKMVPLSQLSQVSTANNNKVRTPTKTVTYYNSSSNTPKTTNESSGLSQCDDLIEEE